MMTQRLARVWAVLVRVVTPPMGRDVRRLLGWLLLAAGAARLGLFSFGAGMVFISPTQYGALLVSASVILLGTVSLRERLGGRLAASYAATICGGMAADLVFNGGSAVSAVSLLLYVWCLLGEAMGRREC